VSLSTNKTVSRVTVQPYIEITEKGKNILNVEISLKGKVINENGHIIGVSDFGRAFLHIFNENWVVEPVSMYIDTILDYHTGDHLAYLRNLKEMLVDLDLNKFGIRNTIANLHYIFIQPELRGQRLGTLFLELITESLTSRFSADFVLLEASPVEVNNFERATYEKQAKQLEHMYTKFGFIKVKLKVASMKKYMYLHLKK
jgi:GNAT superfamily N-acetyltransferase